jgi:hypothetical protein
LAVQLLGAELGHCPSIAQLHVQLAAFQLAELPGVLSCVLIVLYEEHFGRVDLLLLGQLW